MFAAKAPERPVGPHQINCQHCSNYDHKWWRRRRKDLGGSKVMSMLTVYLLSLSATLFICVDAVVVYDVTFVTRGTNRTDYALVGESLELTCRYIMKDDIEFIKQIVWLKDDNVFLRWTNGTPGLAVMTYDFKGHIDHKSNGSHLIVHNVTIEMHGNYKCKLITDLGNGNGDGDRQLAVISAGQCRLSDWRIASDPSDCSETLRLDCKAMFPRPVSSCGLWNDKHNKWIRLLPVHVFEEPTAPLVTSKSQLYRVQYAYKFQLHEPQNQYLLKHAGHLVFKCDIHVRDTSWRLSIEHRMFHFRDGCADDPLETIDKLRANFSRHARARLFSALPKQRNDEIEMLTSNLRYDILPPTSSSANIRQDDIFAGNATAQFVNKSVPLNCWQKPRLGSLARLSCIDSRNSINQQLKLTGSNLLECRPEGWRLPTFRQKVAIKTQKLAPRRSARHGQNVTTTNDLELDLEDDDDDSTPVTTSMSTPPADNDIDLGHTASLIQELTPSELASLLPTCVAVNPRRAGQHHQNRLPLLNSLDENQAKLLESSSGNFKANRKDDKWYTFFASSSAPRSSIYQGSHYFISLTIVSITTSFVVTLSSRPYGR